MQYEVEIGGRVRHVHVRRENGAFVVQMDGRQWIVDAARLDAHRLSLLIEGSADGVPPGASFEVALTRDGAPGQVAVHVDSAVLRASLNGRRWRRPDDHGAHGSGSLRVVAPMPGKVVRVLDTAGQTVTARQPLVVVEAMKMENELRASRDGVVAEIAASEGQSVDAGALLIVMAP